MNQFAIAQVGLGEAGRVLAEDLLAQAGVRLRVWDRDFERPDSRAARNRDAMAGHGGFTAAADAPSLAADCDLILSAVTADQAEAAARSLLPSLKAGAIYVDLNSVSPGTKASIARDVEAAGARFVEAAIMSPIHPRRSASPILLSGAAATDFAALGAELGFSNLRAVSRELGTASATKMCRSVMVKGIEALASESLLAARHYGVEDAVLSSLENLFPGMDWREKSRYLVSRTLEHGERRAAEMREVALTVREAGHDPWMSEGCVQRQAWAPRFAAALDEESLTDMLDRINELAAAFRDDAPGLKAVD